MRRGVDLSLSSEVGLVGVVALSTSASARIYHQPLASMFDILEASQNLPLDLLPQAQLLPEAGFVFSSCEREQVHSPAARWLHEQRAPETAFSTVAFSQVQWRAGCLPQEQVASFAQTQPPERPQQETGTEATGADIVGGLWFDCLVGEGRFGSGGVAKEAWYWMIVL